MKQQEVISVMNDIHCAIGSFDVMVQAGAIQFIRQTVMENQKACLDQKSVWQESYVDMSSHPSDLLPLWQSIRLAPGYGRSWERWILQFDVISMVHPNSIILEDLDNMLQITKYDSDLYCRQEHRFRVASNKHAVKLDQTHKSGAKFYRTLKAEDHKILPGFPVTHECLATLRRSPKGEVHIQIHYPVKFQLYAKLSFGAADLILLEQNACHLRASLVSGVCPTQALLRQDTFVYRASDMTGPFREYWSQYWNRDTEEEEHSDVTWQDTIDRLTQRIPAAEPLPITWHRPDVVQQTISRLRPYKAPGIDGWRAEELRLLPPSAVASLAHIFSQIWHQGLHKDHMIARVVLLAKTKSTRGNRRWASHNDFRLHISTDVQDHRRSVAQILGSTLASSHCRWFTA